MKGELHAAVDRALDDGSATALAVLAFVAVIREGIETSLFLVGQVAARPPTVGALGARRARSSVSAIAALLGVGFYHGSRRLNLATFFRWTGIALVFIAAGLLSHAAHELIEIGVITVGTQTLFDLRAVLPHEPEGGSILGQFLRGAVRLHVDARGHDVRGLADLRGRGPDALPAAGQAQAAPCSDAEPGVRSPRPDLRGPALIRAGLRTAGSTPRSGSDRVEPEQEDRPDERG